MNLVKGKVVPKGLGATFLTCIVEELIARGHEIIIFTLDKEVQEETILQGRNIKVYINNYRKRKRAFNFFKTEIDYLKKMIVKEKLDIVHAHWTYEFAIASLLSKNVVLVTAHDSPFKVLKYMPDFYRFVRLLMAYYCLKQTKTLTVVSEDTKQHLRRYRFYDKEMHVIPNPINIESNYVKNSSTLQQQVVFVSVMNGWVKLKNPKVLLKAYKILRSKYSNVKLVMIGIDYEKTGKAAIWAKENSCHTGVEFKGVLNRNELLEYLNKEADVLVHPSLEESFSLIIAEAMKLGIPIIGGGKSGAVPYTMGNGVAGLLVNIKKANDLFKAMEKLLNYKIRRKFGTEGSKFAATYYSIGEVVNRYEKLYLRLQSKARS